MKQNTSEEIISKLKEAFLDKNLECDGIACMGCWKDVVRSAISMLESTHFNGNGREVEFVEWMARKGYCAMYQYEPFWATNIEDQNRNTTSELFQLFLTEIKTK